MDKKYLGLIGPEDSVYLRLIQREAKKHWRRWSDGLF